MPNSPQRQHSPAPQNNGYGAIDDDSISLGEIAQRLLRHIRLIVVTTFLVTAATVLWVATRTPQYHASATLLLEADEASGGLLSDLALLTKDPAADAEIALIRSRSIAEATAASPAKFNSTPLLFSPTSHEFEPVGPATNETNQEVSWDLTQMDAQGFSTVVEPFDLRPYEGIRRRFTGGTTSEHRLHAQMLPVDKEDAAEDRPESLDVYFPSLTTALIAPHERFLLASDISPSDEGVVKIDFDPSTPFQAFGYQLQLAPTGEYLHQRYRVQFRGEKRAVLDLMAATSASEAGRKTNVVKISVNNASPYVAAEAANALAKNYIRRSIQIGRQKSNRTLGFIQRQLRLQINELKGAEKTVADLQSENPQTISLSDSAKAVIDQLSALELTRTQLELAQTVLAQALEHLESGDFVALARLGKETPNLLALGYIQELATLEAESLRLDRTDVAGYKQLLMAEQLRLRTLIDSVRLSIATYQQGLAAIEAGDDEAIGRIASGPTATSWSADFSADLKAFSELEAELAKLRSEVLPENPALQALEEARQSQLATMRDHVGGALASAQATLKGYQSLHKDYTASIDQWPAQERATIDDSITTLRDRVKANLKSQIQGLDDQITEIATKIKEQDKRLGQLPQSQLALAQATRDLETYSEITAFLLKSEQEAQITAASTSAAAVLIDPAVPPAKRSAPKATTLIAMGIFLGVILGSALALARHALQAALHTEAEVERASGLQVLGAVPDYERGRTRIKGTKRGKRVLAMRDAPQSPQAEAYRAIRAALRQSLRGDHALRTLAVTSCISGEGKTVTNADLAIAFAKAGSNVLLVDCDLRRPRIHDLFETERTPGFAEVLANETDWRTCTHPSGIKNLTILPAGEATSNAGELLASNRSIEILEQLKQDYDLIVFDLPPAVVVADVASFASNLDALLLVYRTGEVPGRLLTKTVNMLQQAEVNLIGVVVNAVYISRAVGGYGYGSGYGTEYQRD